MTEATLERGYGPMRKDPAPFVQPRIACIVSAFDRHPHLRCVLASLQMQRPEVRVIVADNGNTQALNRWTRAIAKSFNYDHLALRMDSCYEPVNLLAPEIEQEWLCCPADDSYYVPKWSKIVLETADANPSWDFIYWDTLYDPRRTGKYEPMVVELKECCIDKASFMIKTRLFCEIGGFPPRPWDDWRDAELAKTIVNLNIKHGKAPGVLCAKN